MSNGVKSHDLCGQLTSPKRKITIPANVSCKRFIVACAGWHVTPPCWNNMSVISVFSKLGNKKLVIIDLCLSPMTIRAAPASFWKKYGLMTLPDQNPHQIVTFFGIRKSNKPQAIDALKVNIWYRAPFMRLGQRKLHLSDKRRPSKRRRYYIPYINVSI